MTTEFRKIKNKYGASVDFETSGSFFDSRIKVTDRIQGVQIGVAIFELETFNVVDKLKVDIKFDESRYEWQTGAEKVHGLSREYLAEHGVSQEQAAIEVASLFLKYFGPEEVLVLGYNTMFDIQFLEQLLIPFEIMPKLHITKVDVASAAFILFGLHRSNDVFEVLGYDKRGAHDALEDAIMTVGAAKKIKEGFGIKVV